MFLFWGAVAHLVGLRASVGALGWQADAYRMLSGCTKVSEKGSAIVVVTVFLSRDIARPSRPLAAPTPLQMLRAHLLPEPSLPQPSPPAFWC